MFMIRLVIELKKLVLLENYVKIYVMVKNQNGLYC